MPVLPTLFAYSSFIRADLFRRVVPCRAAPPCRPLGPLPLIPSSGAMKPLCCAWRRCCKPGGAVDSASLFAHTGANCPCLLLCLLPAPTSLAHTASLLLHLSGTGLHLFPKLTSARWVRMPRRASLGSVFAGQGGPWHSRFASYASAPEQPLPFGCLGGPVSGSGPMSSLQDAHDPPSQGAGPFCCWARGPSSSSVCCPHN